jgi:hypothetical protein
VGPVPVGVDGANGVRAARCGGLAREGDGGRTRALYRQSTGPDKTDSWGGSRDAPFHLVDPRDASGHLVACARAQRPTQRATLDFGGLGSLMLFFRAWAACRYTVAPA